MKKPFFHAAVVLSFLTCLGGSALSSGGQKFFALNEDPPSQAFLDQIDRSEKVNSLFPPTTTKKDKSKEKYLAALKDIWSEVKEMGTYPGEDFIKRDFFIGPDDDDTNKDIHVSILVQKQAAREKMKIQVTYLEPGQGDSRVKVARSSKMVVCFIEKTDAELKSSDFKEEELSPLAQAILQAIRAKKKLLSLCGSGRPG